MSSHLNYKSIFVGQKYFFILLFYVLNILCVLYIKSI